MENYLSLNQLSLKHSNDKIKGRSIESTAQVTKGTVIITSQPLGTVALPQTLNEYCNYCFRKQTSPPLQRCSQCKAAYFCDMACFQNAWLSYHQYICNKQHHSELAADDLDLEMLEKVALNVARYRRKKTDASAPKDKTDETVEVTMETFFSLMGHDDLQPKHVQSKFTRLALEALKKPFIQETGLSVEELVHYLNIFKSNNFSIDDEDMFAIGEGTYPIAALFNHSCRPNAIIMFEGAHVSIRAIQDIAAGTEITISYVDAAHARTHRQKTLRDKYFFDCICVRCTDSNYLGLIDTLLGEEESEWDKAQQLLSKSQQINKEIQDWDLLQMCKEYDRKNDGGPDICHFDDLQIPNYTHYFIQFFAPYLLTWNQLELHQEQPGAQFKSSITVFDDPVPSLAKPAVQNTYDEIMETAIKKMIEHQGRNKTGINPIRLSTLTACTRLFYDEMTEGHWRNAVKLGMYVLVQYCLIYPPYHPMLAQHYLVLAKACWNSIIKNELLNRRDGLEKVYQRGVRRWIMCSKETVSVAFGKHSSLYRETLELEWLFVREQKLK